ncbi:intraflagellar transport protein-like protein [Strigomonas culicis]|uniref:Intraflagellar transport protein-like protein n=1 Tax=Strigomonas culicis TaxID=28005 RepID=S9U239_9TRYP|nr:intraflagellar transport protein-like protein [Strigomonas culicis]|eukprot:EPY23003.1 intraflagellar transport protein-like protein [Strigomonas culicis]
MSNPFTGVPGSSMGTSAGLRPGTTMRPGSRMQAAGMGGSLQQPVSVTAAAPIAREGMRSASRAGTSAGPGRQVGDRSYYIGLLRPKCAELSAEIDRLTEQEELINKNSSVLTQLQQKSRLLNEEITRLKGTLADVNLGVENAASRDVKAVKQQYMQLEKQNVVKRKEVDELFLVVKKEDDKAKRNADLLEEEMQQLDKRILAENQDYGMYKANRDENFAVSDLVLERQHEVRMLAAKQDLLMARLAHDPDKKRAAETLRSILRKRREKEELTRQCSLSVEQEKQMLIQQVKSTRSDIEVLERQVNDTRDTLQESRVRLSALDEEVKNYSGDNVRAFQELQERDQEMQRFIDEYPDREKEESSRIEEAEKSIATLLQRISQALELQRQMPAEGNPGALEALHTEVDARRDQIKNDQRTHERLEKELLERKAELDKVANLDKKIKEELETHSTKMTEQRAEMEQYNDLGTLRDEVEQLRKDLIAQKAYLVRVRDTGKVQLHMLSGKYETDQRQLQSDEVYTTLTTQEQKLRMLWQSTFTLEDFVRLREKDTQYLASKAASLRLVDEINLLLKDPARLAGHASGAPTINLQE